MKPLLTVITILASVSFFSINAHARSGGACLHSANDTVSSLEKLIKTRQWQLVRASKSELEIAHLRLNGAITAFGLCIGEEQEAVSAFNSDGKVDRAFGRVSRQIKRVDKEILAAKKAGDRKELKDLKKKRLRIYNRFFN